MRETSKAAGRRTVEGWYRKYLVGPGIDIGCGDDPILPADRCRHWDLQDGDAQLLPGVPAGTFRWVYSSNCLEHLRDAKAGLRRWWEVLTEGGYLLFTVPDEDLYEQGLWPSRFNEDHKWTFTVHKTGPSWSPVSLSVLDLVRKLPGCQVIKIQTVDAHYDYEGGIWDRTMAGGEAFIEVILKKVPVKEKAPAISRSRGPGWRFW